MKYFPVLERLRAGRVGPGQHYRRRSLSSRLCHLTGSRSATLDLHQSRYSDIVFAERHLVIFFYILEQK